MNFPQLFVKNADYYGMDTCRKNIKEFSIYEHFNFQKFVLKFISADKNRARVFMTTMEKEIFEQPKVIENLIRTFIEEKFNFKVDKNIKKVKLVASGSSYHCALLGVQLFHKFTNLDADSFYSGEFMLEENFEAESDTLFIFISQSGETYDTLECLKMIKRTKAKTLCITNCEDSTLFKLCDFKLLSTAGKEESIASTKALSAQLFCLALLTLNYGNDESIKDKETEIIKKLPAKISEILDREKELNKIVNVFKKNKSVVLLGTKECYALAKEGALKIKETSYINTTAYPMGEFLHGHVAVLNRKIPVISALTAENYYSQLRVIRKIRTDYNPFIITLGTSSDEKDIKSLSNISIDINDNNYITRMFLILVIYQLIALKTAMALRMNVDKPKGLKKVVS